MNLIIPSFLAMATPPGEGGGGLLGSPLILFGAIIAIFYFMIIRPQQKRMKEHQNLLASVKRGDKVVLSNGMHGTVHEVEDKTVLIEVAKNTVIRFDKGAVQSVVADA
jgi:preprotein translocase subunit YajC